MRASIITVVCALLLVSVCTVSGQRRRIPRPPSSFGRQQEQDFGQFPSSGNQQQQLSQQANQLEDDDDGDIQQVSRPDPEEFSGFRPKSTKQPAEADRRPPRYAEDEADNDVYSTTPEAVTPKGTFRGLKQVVGGVAVYVFYGIPFAKPPIGDLRFKRPVPSDKLREPYDATTLPNACPQNLPEIFHGFKGEAMWAPNTNLSEDCLYANLWVPASVFENKESELSPVLFWIYGGGFFSGSNSLDVYNGAVLAASQGLVVVSVQYRLGPLGFLYFGTDDAPGNMGLLDQSLGLRWVRENIEYFGGDPNTVTAAGESCGSASVGFHLVSPLSKSYIKRGIMTSGLPNIVYAIKTPEEMKSRSYEFAKHAGCNEKDPKEIVECLKRVESDKLITIQWKLYKNILDFLFSPTVDNYFLTDHPDNLIRHGKAKRAELMLGTVQDEGTYFTLYHYLNYFSHTKSTSVPHDRFLDIMTELFQDYNENEREAIIDEYTHWENPEDGLVNQKSIGDAIGDAWFTCPHRKFADEWANRGLNVFYYHFTERFSSNPWAKWMGVMHGDDIGLLFGAPYSDYQSHTDAERNMSLSFMRMVGKFARVGVPSYKWERYTSEHPVYLDVNATIVSDASTPDLHGPNAKKCAFWNKLLPLLRKTEVECFNPSQEQRSPPQFGSSQKQHQNQQAPQWNPNGQGVHGGQGFHVNNMRPPQPSMQYQQYPMYCGSGPQYYPPPHFSQDYRMNDGCGHQPPPPVPTAQSCECTVQETTGQTVEKASFGGTPPPVF